MSETFEGMPTFEPPVAKTRPASAVILWRAGARGREVFWVRRGKALRFAGGFYAFPGGKVDAADAAIPVLGATGEAAALLVSAARELFEETGVLLAEGVANVSAHSLAEARRALLADAVSFAELLVRHELKLRASDFTPAGRWITPTFAPVRFDARFFLAALPADQNAEVWPGELSDGAWITCDEALDAWRAGRVLLHPPSRYSIECLQSAPPPECLSALLAPPYCEDYVASRIDFQAHVYIVPLRTPTLPPATHTNTYLVGDRALALIDPGASDAGELTRLFAVIDDFAREGRPVTQIWLTHHHGDHVGGLGTVWERLGRVPVFAHPQTADRVAVPCKPAGEGDLLLGRWRALHTPGHARGHLCFFDEGTGALLCGDMVSGVSTIVIDPPEGDMAEYLRQLERLRALAPRTLYPAHGTAIPDAVEKLDEYLAHRLRREQKVVAALERGGTLSELTAVAYDDTPEFMYPIAERSCLASLLKLEAEGRAHRIEAGWRAL
jgi:endoribonuclease LACTB2